MYYTVDGWRRRDFASLQENALLVTTFSDQKLLVTRITNLDTSLQSKKIIGY